MTAKVFLPLLATLMFAQSQPPAHSTANFRAGRYGVSSELVLINVSVVTEHGQPVRGLPASTFSNMAWSGNCLL